MEVYNSITGVLGCLVIIRITYHSAYLVTTLFDTLNSSTLLLCFV
jgi:hypothetical protein